MSYHKTTINMAYEFSLEDFWARVNESMDMPFLVHSEWYGQYYDCGYCLDKNDICFSVNNFSQIF